MTDPWNASKDVVHSMQGPARPVARGGHTRAGGAPTAQPTGAGEALDGAIRVEVTGGQVTDVRIDRRALRDPDLGVAVLAATNAALDAARTAVVESFPAAPSLDEMTRTLDELATDSARALDEATEGARRSMAAIQRISELHRSRP